MKPATLAILLELVAASAVLGQEPEGLSFDDLRRTEDAFFVKLSYLHRV